MIVVACYDAGMICTRCSPRQVAEDAIHEARGICMREYAAAPDVTVYGDPKFSFAYVPSHLHHMTFELVKALLSRGPKPLDLPYSAFISLTQHQGMQHAGAAIMIPDDYLSCEV